MHCLARPPRAPLIAAIAAIHIALIAAAAASNGTFTRWVPAELVVTMVPRLTPVPTPVPTLPAPRLRTVAPEIVLPRIDITEAVAVAPPPISPPSREAATPPAVVAREESTSPPRFDLAYLDNPAPAYPSVARRLREEGRVLLRVRVDPEGAVLSVEVQSSSGHARLDQAALEAVRRWRFVPARAGARAVAGLALVPVNFQLS